MKRQRGTASAEVLRTQTVRRVRCRFCPDWDRPVWVTREGGRRVSGFDLLSYHIELDHPAEYDALQRHLDDTCKTEPESAP